MSKIQEEWRPIPRHEGYYWVNSQGDVKNAEGRILAKTYCGGNSYKVKLQSCGQKEERYISTLLAEVFPELIQEVEK